MSQILNNNDLFVWIQDERFEAPTAYVAMERNAGLTGKSVPVVTLQTNYERDRMRGKSVLNQVENPPGDGPSNTLNMYNRALLTPLESHARSEKRMTIQERVSLCGMPEDPDAWDKITIWGWGKLTTFNPADGPQLGANDEINQLSGTLQYLYWFILLRTSLSALATGTTEDVLDIDGLWFRELDQVQSGYPGPDEVLFAGLGNDGATESDLLATGNGGGSWAAVTTAPFSAGNFETIDFVQVRPDGCDGGRVIIGTNTSVAGTPAQIRAGSFEYGAETTVTWDSIVQIGAAADTVEALEFLLHNRAYIGVAGDIYVSTDQGESVGSALYTGSTQINGFAINPTLDEVWAFGANDLILRESNQDGTFVERNGPGDGSAFTALAVADDGTLWAGYGTKIYRSTNEALNAGGWVEVQDFGGNHVVKEIEIIDDFSQTLRVVVDDTTPDDGSVFESVDGGGNLREITVVPNTGYNAGYFSRTNPNLAYVAGDGGVIHQLAP